MGMNIYGICEVTRVIVIVCCLLGSPTYALDNGLALTPPMGWLAWERFRCERDCEKFPDSCIAEKLFHDMADRLVEDGWKDVGYDRVNIDDCWSWRQRDNNSRMYADPNRFPNGMKKLADYMHERGLKLGIYGDVGTKTCAGYPGSQGYEKIDAQTFADWGVDMLKHDSCNTTPELLAIHYPLMGKELNATGRPILYSIEWPLHVKEVNYTLLGEIANMWRNYNDIDDSFEEVITIINWWGDHQDLYIPAAGPGRWNDPDMLIGGDFALSPDQAKLQFGMWAILAAPLFMSNDLRTIKDEMKDILQNKKVIQINQDPLGVQGRRVRNGSMQLWVRPLIGGQQAIAVISTRIDGIPDKFEFTLEELGIEKPEPKYLLTDVYDIEKDKVVGLTEIIDAIVNPNGIVMYKATPIVKEEVVEELLEFDVL